MPTTGLWSIWDFASRYSRPAINYGYWKTADNYWRNAPESSYLDSSIFRVPPHRYLYHGLRLHGYRRRQRGFYYRAQARPFRRTGWFRLGNTRLRRYII